MKTLFPVKLVRRLIGGAALTSLALGSAVLLTACETDSSPPYSSSEQAEEQYSDDDLHADAPPEAALAHDLVGSTVRSRIDDEEIGNIEDVLVDHQGNPVAVVVNVGRFLGAGDRLVAIDWSRVSLADRDAQHGTHDAGDDDFMGEGSRMRDREHTVVVDATREELEGAPEFDPEAWEREWDY